MGTTPQPRRRRRRLLRTDADAGGLLILLRAAVGATGETVDNIVGDALLMATAYVWDDAQRGVELLFAVSLWELPHPGAEAEVLARFPGAPFYLEFERSALEAAGFPVLPTGADPHHYEAQLLTGVGETVPDQIDDPAVHALLRTAAARFVALAGPLRDNPAYHGVKAKTTDNP